MSEPFVVACIPAYNEERNIASVIVQTLKHVDRVLVCDDCPRDLTGAFAEGLGARAPGEILRKTKLMLDRKRGWDNPFGNGKAAAKIVDVLRRLDG